MMTFLVIFWAYVSGIAVNFAITSYWRYNRLLKSDNEIDVTLSRVFLLGSWLTLVILGLALVVSRIQCYIHRRLRK